MTFDDLISKAASYAGDKKSFDAFTSDFRDAYQKLTEELKAELRRIYWDAVKYYKEWEEAEDNLPGGTEGHQGVI